MMLGCGSARVAVHGQDAVLDELSAACHPWITPHPPCTGSETWTVQIDADRFQGEPVASRTGAAVRIAPDRRTLHLMPPTQPESMRPLVRLVRALMRRQLAARGELFLDAAVLIVGGHSIALVGGSCSGKTSTLLAAVHRYHGQLVANDDASFHVRHGTPIARGYPRAVEIRRDTLPHLGGIEKGLTAASESDGAARVLYVQPHQLAAALGVELAAATAVCGMVLLGRGEHPQLHRLGLGAAAAAVAEHLAPADPFEAWLDPYLPAPASTVQAAEHLVSAVPVWRLTQPLTALEQSADLLAHLTSSLGG